MILLPVGFDRPTDHERRDLKPSVILACLPESRQQFLNRLGSFRGLGASIDLLHRHFRVANLLREGDPRRFGILNLSAQGTDAHAELISVCTCGFCENAIQGDAVLCDQLLLDLGKLKGTFPLSAGALLDRCKLADLGHSRRLAQMRELTRLDLGVTVGFPEG